MKKENLIMYKRSFAGHLLSILNKINTLEGRIS